MGLGGGWSSPGHEHAGQAVARAALERGPAKSHCSLTRPLGAGRTAGGWAALSVLASTRDTFEF